MNKKSNLVNNYKKKKIVMQIIKNNLLVYSERYGAICYAAGTDKKRSLPEDIFLTSTIEKIVKEIEELYGKS